MKLLSILLLITSLFSSIDSRLYNRCVKSVVFVASEDGYGTGVIIDKHHIITNHHVISGYRNVKILTYNKNIANLSPREAFQYKNSNEYNFIEGEVIAIDPERDLAMIKTTSRLTNIANLASSYSEPEINDDVFAIGNPGASSSLFNSTKGSISALPKNNEVYYGDFINRKFDSIQTQAPINGGNSGGPLINDKGYVIGLVCASTHNVQLTNLAIHISEVQNFIKKAKKGGIYFRTNLAHSILKYKNLWEEYSLKSTYYFYGYDIIKAKKKDENKDGKTDGVCYWIQDNYLPDYCKYDRDYDGSYEEEAYYYRRNWWVDAGGSTAFRPRYTKNRWVWRADTNNDGRKNACAYDDDGNGVPDKFLIDYYRAYFWKNYQ